MSDERGDSRIGFMGLGIMGRAMAENILRHGYPLAVYNRTGDRTAILSELGAGVAATPRELAEGCDVLVSMLTGPEAFISLLTGEDGCAKGLAPGKVVVNMGTVSPADAREMAHILEPFGVAYVDAPVSGSKRPAEEGSLVILAGGDSAVLDKVEPLLLTMGRKVVRCGGVGQGAMMKLALNMLLGIMVSGLGETASFARKGGLDLEAVLDALALGPMSCPLFDMKRDMLSKDYYPAQFPLKHMAKDLKYVLDTAFTTGAAVPGASQALQLFRGGAARGLGDMDFAAVAKVLEAMSGRE